jgi:hypothetical protein
MKDYHFTSFWKTEHGKLDVNVDPGAITRADFFF